MKRPFFLMWFLLVGASAAATPPVAQFTGVLTGQANTCSANNAVVTAAADFDVPATSSYQVSVFFLVPVPSGMGMGMMDMMDMMMMMMGSMPAEDSYGMLYASPYINGPAAGLDAPINLSRASSWYASVPPLPSNTRLMAVVTTYSGLNGTGTVESTSRINWDCSSGEVLSISNQGGAAISASQVPTAMAIEYYNRSLDHYFVTAAPAEIADLDSGRTVGWKRTGESFRVYAEGDAALSPVCRFYIPADLGDSHFISASVDECGMVKARFPRYTFEGYDVFYTVLPSEAAGLCPSGTSPVFRLWNQRLDSNHRYVTDTALRAEMMAHGYVAEGYGPNGVAMCSPN